VMYSIPLKLVMSGKTMTYTYSPAEAMYILGPSRLKLKNLPRAENTSIAIPTKSLTRVYCWRWSVYDLILLGDAGREKAAGLAQLKG
jgi:hypothetical protein